MSLIFMQPDPFMKPDSCPLQKNLFLGLCGGLGEFIGLSTRPAYSKKVFINSCQPPSFIPKKLHERQALTVNTQVLLLLLVLKAISEAPANQRRQFPVPGQNNAEGYPGSATNQRYRQHAPGNPFTQGTHSGWFGYQNTSGSQQYRAAPSVGRPDMAKVHEALEGLEIRGRELKTITKSDVSRAYKNKARQHHPDKAVNHDVSGDKFKEILNYRDQLFAYIQFRDSRR